MKLGIVGLPILMWTYKDKQVQIKTLSLFQVDYKGHKRT